MLMTKTIFSNLLNKYATRLHPVEQRAQPPGNRGTLGIIADKCISCRMCANKCPTQVITVNPEAGIWEYKVMGCVFCGVCVEVCPTHCLDMSNEYRRPFLEGEVMRCNVKVRPKKVKAAADAGEAKAGAVAEDKAGKETKAAGETKSAGDAGAAKPAAAAKDAKKAATAKEK